MSDIMGILASLTGQAGGLTLPGGRANRYTPGEEARRLELLELLKKGPEQASPVDPSTVDDKPKWAQMLQSLGLSLADAGTTYASGMNRNIIPSRHLDKLRGRREARAKEMTAYEQHKLDRESSERKFTAGIDLQEMEGELARRTRSAERGEDAARQEAHVSGARKHDIFMAELQGRIDAENIKLREAGRDDTAKRMMEIVSQGRQQVYAWVKQPPEGMDVNDMRDELEFILETEGVYGIYRESVMEYFERKIAQPAREQSDIAYAETAEAAIVEEPHRLKREAALQRGPTTFFGGGPAHR